MSKIIELANEFQDEMVMTRRLIHQNPELGFHEVQTSALVVEKLRSSGIETSAGIAKTGVIAHIQGRSTQKVGMIRFDMDALPIQEETGLDFSSRNPGVMHACGHDGHTAIGITTCKILQAVSDTLNGSIKCIFQPAEEGDGGAVQMIKEGVLDQPRPDFVLGLHLWNEKPVGWVGIKPGPVMAASDIFEIKVNGKGGHGGKPDQTIDPIVCAAQIVLALQTIISRNLSGFEPAVLSVTSISGGTAFNVVPENVILKGTIRTFSTEAQALIHARMKEISEFTAKSYRCQVDLTFQRVASAVVNDPKITAMVKDVLLSKFPDLEIDEKYQVTVSEDMAFYMEQLPGCFILLGSANPAKNAAYGHHHPRFTFDEDIMPVAAGLIAESCQSILNKISA